MAKKITARAIQATDQLAGIVDRGGEVDNSLKNLTVEDKGIKAKLATEAGTLFEPGEQSIRIDGNIMTALVSSTEKYELDVSKDVFSETEKAIRTGIFGDAVKLKRSLVVPQDKVEAAYAILKQMGLADVLLETGFEVNPEEYRVLTGSAASTPEKQAAVDTLKSCVQKKVSFRVSYDKK
jgi:hypothetical protein